MSNPTAGRILRTIMLSFLYFSDLNVFVLGATYSSAQQAAAVISYVIVPLMFNEGFITYSTELPQESRLQIVNRSLKRSATQLWYIFIIVFGFFLPVGALIGCKEYVYTTTPSFSVTLRLVFLRPLLLLLYPVNVKWLNFMWPAATLVFADSVIGIPLKTIRMKSWRIFLIVLAMLFLMFVLVQIFLLDSFNESANSFLSIQSPFMSLNAYILGILLAYIFESDSLRNTIKSPFSWVFITALIPFVLLAIAHTTINEVEYLTFTSHVIVTIFMPICVLLMFAPILVRKKWYFLETLEIEDRFSWISWLLHGFFVGYVDSFSSSKRYENYQRIFNMIFFALFIQILCNNLAKLDFCPILLKYSLIFWKKFMKFYRKILKLSENPKKSSQNDEHESHNNSITSFPLFQTFDYDYYDREEGSLREIIISEESVDNEESIDPYKAYLG